MIAKKGLPSLQWPFSGTLALFSLRLAELHFGLALGGSVQRGPQGGLEAALRLFRVVLIVS